MRHAFGMRLRAGAETEYADRHAAIWPELAELLTGAGIRNYCIFRSGLDLFGYFEVDDLAALDALADQPVMRKWWDYMAPLMDCNPDNSPVQTPFTEVFHHS